MDRSIPAAPGVVYQQEAHGLRMFRCAALGATLTDRSCVANYRLAKSALRTNYRPHLQHCAYCPIGACHAGEKPRARSSKYCPRCHKYGMRFVASAGLCVSCYNRMGELKRGKNARGNPPIELLQRAPVQHSVVFTHNGERVQYNRLAVDQTEMLLAAVFMARSPESVRFVFGRPDLEPVDNEPAPGWQRPNAASERRSLDRKKRLLREGESCGM